MRDDGDYGSAEEVESLRLWSLIEGGGSVGDVCDALAHGARIDWKGPRDGMTALHVAAERGDAALCEYFVQNGADVRALDRRGRSVLDVATCDLGG